VQFICSPKETHSVKKALAAKGLQTGAARQEYIAHTHAQLDDATLKTASDMLDELEALDEVVRIFDNIIPIEERPV
jgi:transcriptional/translational regulatory protein YebC/TACO1